MVEVSLFTVLPWLNLLPNSAVEWRWFLFAVGNNEYVNLRITLVCLVILKSGLCALAWHTLYIRQEIVILATEPKGVTTGVRHVPENCKKRNQNSPGKRE